MRERPREADRSLSASPAIALTGLSVAFPGRSTAAIDNLTMTIAPGEMLGVTGASGAGKSTLLRVLAGDLEPTAGHILIDGTPPDKIRRCAFAWLAQRPYLFPGTLADNIALGRADADAIAVLDAALAAGLGPMLTRLPRGVDTPVGESGWGLSGGEAHRVALARAFLKRAPVLLFDEPTAHLDAASESGIIEVIRRLARFATTIVATRSPALLTACDRVVALDSGRLMDAPAEEGLEEAAVG